MAGNLQNIIGQIQQAFSNAEKTVRNTDTNRNASSVREPNTAVSNDVRRTRTGANRMQTSRQDAVRISNNIRTTTRSARAKAQNVVQANSSVANYMPSSQFNWTNATLSSTLSRMHELSGNDTAKWQQYVGMFQNEVNNPNSPIYSPYLFNRTYTYGKYAASNEAATLKFEQQWADAKAKAAYWAGRTDLNLSDDDIIARVNLDGYSEIKALNKKIAEGGTGYYTRQLGYSPDVLYGVIWAARNGGGTGNDLTDLLAYGNGVGNLYQRNDDIQSRLDPTNERYNPYSVGSTYDDATSYFGVSQFDKDWLNQNRYLLNGSDKDVKMYQSVYAAEQTTLKAEAEYAELQSRMQEVFASNMDDPDEIMDMLFDKDPYNARGYTDALTKLGDMDESLKSGKIISMTRPVDYSYNDIRQQVVQHCEDVKAQKTAAAVANNVSAATGANNVSSQANTLIDEARDNAMKSAGRTIRAQGTGEEKLVFKTSNAGFENYMQQINDAVAAGTLDKAGAYVALLNGANEYAAANYLAMREAEDSRAALKELQGEMVDGSFLDPMFAEEDELIANIRASYELASRLSNTGSADASLLNLMDYLYDNGKEYVPTQWSATTAFDFLRESGYGESDINYAARETIIHKEKEVAKIDSVLSQVKEAGIKGADKYIKNLERKKESCQRDIQDAQYYLLPQEKSDFSTVVSDYKQKAEEAWAGKEWTYNKFLHNSNDGVPFEAYALYHPERSIEAGIPYNLLTENERNTYLYLAATDGKDSANEYYNYLQEETLAVRKAFALQETASEAASDGLAGAAFSTLMSITSSPLQVAGSIYSVVQGLRGEEINPYHSTFAANMFISSTRGTVKSEIDEAFGADSIGAKIANIGYDALTSSGDSLLSGAMGMGSTVASVLSMGTEAASGAVMDAKLRGATDSQALLYGGMTLAAESGTEFLPMDNIIDAFKGANTTAAKQFVADVLKDVAAEGVGEGLNELIEGVGDDLIMGELSERNQAIAQYMAEGMTEEEATRKATDDFVAQIGYAAITGAVSGAVSMTTSRIAGTVSGESGTERVSYEDATNYYNAIADAETSTAAQQNTVNFDMAAYQELAALTQSLQSSNAGKATAISGVMQFSGMDMETARAAGQALVDKVGGSKAVLAMQQIIYSAAEHGTNLAESVRAIANSALAGSESTTAQIRQFAEGNVTSEALNSFIAESGQIAETMSADITQRVTENAIANATREVISDGALDGVKTYEVALQQAKENVRAAAENLARAVAEKDAAWQNMQDINAKFLQNPADAQLHGMMQQAINDMTGKVKVIEEYKQSVAKFETQQKVAETTLKNMREAAMKHARQEAVQRVMDQRAARAAEIAQQAAESLQNTDAGNTSEVVPTQTFEQQLNTWDGKEQGRVFTLGETSDVLHAIGVPDAKIVMYGDKIINIKKKHPGMTDTVIKQIPQIIDDPVIVMKSRTVSNRITMFGEVMDANDVPVLAILDLNTAKDEVVNADFMTLVSAYGKDNKAQSFINSSEILYINKNKADAWQVSTGLQLPFESATIGKDSVAQNAASVNPSIFNSTVQYSYGSNGEQVQGTNSAPVVSPVETARTLAEELGIGAALGTRKMDIAYRNSVPKEVRGYYEQRAKYMAVREGEASSYGVTMHEAGHAIADKTGLTGTQEMIHHLDPSFAKSYSAEALPGEAFAEFTSLYMQDSAQAETFAGRDYVQQFEAALRNAGIEKAVHNARDRIQAYVTATTLDRVKAGIIDQADTVKKGSLAEREAEYVTNVFDWTRPMEDVDKAVYKATGKYGNLRKTAKRRNFTERVASNLFTNALTDADGSIIGDAFNKAFEKIDAKNADDFISYGLMKHALDRDVQNKQVFANDITTAQMQQEIARLDAVHPEYAEAWNNFHDLWRKFTQAWLVDTGKIPQADMDAMNAMYPNYLPTVRYLGNEAGYKNLIVTFTLKSAKGSDLQVINPLDSIANYVNRIVDTVYKNNAALEWHKAYQSTEGLGQFAREITSDMARESVNTENVQEQVRQILEDNNTDGDVLADVLNAIGPEAVAWRDTGTSREGNVLAVQLENGRKAYYQFTREGKLLYNALTGDGKATSAQIKNALRPLARLTGFMSKMATTYAPTFAASNPIKDIQSSVNYGSWAATYVDGIAKWVKAFREVWKETDRYKEYLAQGGGGWNAVSTGTRASTDEYRAKLFKDYWKRDTKSKIGHIGEKAIEILTLDRLNEVIENTSRYTEYRFGKHDLSTAEGRMEAFQAAQEVTTDFAGGGAGKAVVAARSLVPFLNPNLQGVYRAGREFTGRERGRLATRMGKRLVNTAMASAIAAVLRNALGDDEDKKRFALISDEIKMGHLILPNWFNKNSDRRFIRIPISQDPFDQAMHMFVSSAIEQYDGTDDITTELLAGASAIVSNVSLGASDLLLEDGDLKSRLNGIMSGTVLGPFWGIFTNQNYYGGQIVSDRLSELSAPLQYDDTTPEAFKWLGKITKTSPKQLEYIFNQYGGYGGQMLVNTTSDLLTGDFKPIDIAKSLLTSFHKRFTIDSAYTNDVSSAYSASRAFMTELTNNIKKTNTDGGLLLGSLTEEERKQAYAEVTKMTSKGGLIYDTNKEISDLWGQVNEAKNNTDMTDAERNRQLLSLRDQIVDKQMYVNDQLMEFYGKYVTGKNLFEGMIGDIHEVTPYTAFEKLSSTFADDYDNGADYMVKSHAVWEATGKDAAIPHPNTSFSEKGVEYVISDDDWPEWEIAYRDTYQGYIDRNSMNWDTMKDEERLELLKKAHSKAHDAAKKQYMQKHGGK